MKIFKIKKFNNKIFSFWLVVYSISYILFIMLFSQMIDYSTLVCTIDNNNCIKTFTEFYGYGLFKTIAILCIITAFSYVVSIVVFAMDAIANISAKKVFRYVVSLILGLIFVGFFILYCVNEINGFKNVYIVYNLFFIIPLFNIFCLWFYRIFLINDEQ